MKLQKSIVFVYVLLCFCISLWIFLKSLKNNGLSTSVVNLRQHHQGKKVNIKFGACEYVWWPRGIDQLGPHMNITPTLIIGNACRQTKLHTGYIEPFQNIIKLFKHHVNGSERMYHSIPTESSLFEASAEIRIGHFQPIDFTRGYVLSAFLDNREINPLIKVLYMMPLGTPTLYCHAFCNGEYLCVTGRSTLLSVAPCSKNCLWQQYVLHCHFPNCKVKTVSVSSSYCLKPTNILEVIDSNPKSEHQKLFGACLSLIFQKSVDDLPTLVNYFESFLHFGGDVVYLYGTYDVEPEVMNVLHYYEKRGVLKIYDWQVPDDVTSLHYFGKNLQIMDCNYRHMNKVEYILFIDLDEMLLPVLHGNYSGLLQNIFSKNDCAIRVQRYQISQYILNQNNYSTYFDTNKICFQKNAKSVAKAHYTLNVQIHRINMCVKPMNKNKIMAADTAVIIHFRNEFICTQSPSKTDRKYTLQIVKLLQNCLPRIVEKSRNLLRIADISNQAQL